MADDRSHRGCVRPCGCWVQHRLLQKQQANLATASGGRHVKPEASTLETCLLLLLVAQAACSRSLVTISLYRFPPTQLSLLSVAQSNLSFCSRSVQGLFLFHVPEGPCTPGCTLRAEVASSLSLSHTCTSWIARVFTGWENGDAHGTPSYPKASRAAPHLAALRRSLRTRPAGGPVGVRNGLFLSKLLPKTRPGETCTICCTLEGVI